MMFTVFLKSPLVAVLQGKPNSINEVISPMLQLWDRSHFWSSQSNRLWGEDALFGSIVLAYSGANPL
jgi:hypothetical protein